MNQEKKKVIKSTWYINWEKGKHVSKDIKKPHVDESFKQTSESAIVHILLTQEVVEVV